MTGYYTCKSRQFLIKESLVALENNTQKNMIIEIKVLVSKPNKGFPGRSVVNSPPVNAGLIPGSEDALVKEMATCSRIIGWRIPWTGEPGGL